jgi:hypothetical protein
MHALFTKQLPNPIRREVDGGPDFVGRQSFANVHVYDRGRFANGELGSPPSSTPTAWSLLDLCTS